MAMITRQGDEYRIVTVQCCIVVVLCGLIAGRGDQWADD